MTTPDPDTAAQLALDTQHTRLATADALVALNNYGMPGAMPHHLHATLDDLLRPVCDNSAQLNTLMTRIINGEQPTTAWLRLHHQSTTPDTQRQWRVAIHADSTAATARDAALDAWDAIACDQPPIVTVWAAHAGPDTAVTIDLAQPEPASTDT